MDDDAIVRLYWDRNQYAIEESQNKYGNLLKRIAFNILSDYEDSEECVNDTYVKAWDSIPPENPVCLSAYLGRITRNIAINLWNKKHTQKRGGDTILSELSECISANDSVNEEVETAFITEIINRWLRSLPKEDRVMFIKRYWFGDSVKSIAREFGITSSTVSGKIYRMRQKLKAILQEEGVFI